MMKRTLLIAAAVLGLSAPAIASEGSTPPQLKWSFSGPFGKFDEAQLQRGFKVYREVCSSCHSLNYVAFRNLAQPGGPGFSEAQVRALAAEYKVQDGPNEAGDMFERAGRPADHFPAPFPNENAAAAANGGKAPPDLSLMPKARTYERGFPWFIFDIFTQFAETGPDYVVAVLNGYHEAPAGFSVPAGGHYNTSFPGNVIAMPKPLSDGQVEYPKGPDGKSPVPETVDQYARDVTAFLMWTAEPHLDARKRIGFQVMLFLLVLSGLLYFTKKKIWARVEH
ncbi:cytochrome c1 [Microvirga terricola]|uniref:Cytochrome c1 n=1 Tax=Microvirga terricola TaxID=2719797 RepID=A0ABX0VA80_9HYPH|nr:cytochrome c1 [Microvirga terricola]NIX76241.1 cytochrome c1 [Microvirga terricola]